MNGYHRPVRPGELIDDRFELVREAGAGGMGVVFQARDRRDDSFVALKILTLEGQQRPRAVAGRDDRYTPPGAGCRAET